MKITPEQFALLCYLVLMDHHGAGYIEAHPSYIKEKTHIMLSGYDAIDYLDHENQFKVWIYLSKWKIEVPEEIIKKQIYYNPESRPHCYVINLY